jgi:ABC-2 type transport system ATP-binding protein
MPQIIVENLVKTYQVAVRAPGVWGALRSLARRRYRTVRALDGVSFAIERGELVGYIGPNGAGKTTTVKVLSGIVVPDAGRCEVAGRVPWKQPILGHADPLGAPAYVGWIAPLAGPVFLAVCLQVWRFGVRHYRSTGS